jgi:putative peptidoglycan lipid II flippase
VSAHVDEFDTVLDAALRLPQAGKEAADQPTVRLSAPPPIKPTDFQAHGRTQAYVAREEEITPTPAPSQLAEDFAALATNPRLQSVDVSAFPTLQYIPVAPAGARAGMSGKVARATIFVMAATMLASVLGFVREALIAREFGASAQTDAYVTAVFIPNILQSLLISGSLTIIFIPILADYLDTRDRREAWRVVSIIGNIVCIVLVALAVAGIVLTPALVALYAPFFSPQTRDLTIELTQILFLSVFSLGLSSYFVAVLNAFRVFGLPALTTAIFNAGVIVALLVFGASFGIEGLAWATVAASGLQLVVAGAPLLWLRPRYSLTLSLRHPAARQLARLALPQFASVLNGQVYFLVERILASGLIYGSISALNYANKLWIVPANVLGNSLLTVIFPQIAEEAATKKYRNLIRTMGSAFRSLLTILVPISILCMLLAEPVTRIVYERGAFGERDVALTAACLRFASLGIFPSAGIWLCTRVLFALKDARSTLLLGMLVNIPIIVLNIYLTPLLGAPALALCFSLDSLAYLILLLLAIRRHVGSIGGRWLLDGLWRVGLGSAALTLAAFAVMQVALPPETWLTLLPNTLNTRFVVPLATVITATLAGAVAYVVTAICLRLPEVGVGISWALRLRQRG